MRRTLFDAGRVVEQQHDQAADRRDAVERTAEACREQPALAGVEDDVLAGGAVADARDELAHRGEHAGESLDALGVDLAARVGGELELVERDAGECAVDALAGEAGDVEQGGRRCGRPVRVGHGDSVQRRVE
jgi:hypothetical protein